MRIIAATIFALLLLESCSHNYYVPNTQNVPLFVEKNEYRISVSTGESAHNSTVDIQTAYSITDNIAVMGNMMYAEGGNKNDNINWGYGYNVELAAGYYKPITKHLIFEIYGGGSGARQQHYYSAAYETATLGSMKMFAQPSIGLTSGAVDLILSSNLSYLRFNRLNYNPGAGTFYNSATEDLIEIALNRSSFLVEGGVTIRFGWKYLKLQVQTLASENLTNKDLNFEKFKISAGLNFAFAERFKKDKTNNGNKNNTTYE